MDGEITNVSDRPLQNVMIFVTFLGSSGDVITTASALVDYQPVMPGQTSPFKVIGSGNPLIRDCRVHIGTLWGGHLAVEP
jgi:hypothetical protein